MVGSLFAAVVGSAAALAAPPIEVTKIDWGIAGQPLAERWGPVTLWVRSSDRPFSGIVTCEFQQDGSQPALVVAPVATTPGISTPIELTLALPAQLDSIKFTFLREGSRPTAYAAATLPGGSELPMPSILKGQPQVWASLETSLGRIQTLKAKPADKPAETTDAASGDGEASAGGETSDQPSPPPAAVPVWSPGEPPSEPPNPSWLGPPLANGYGPGRPAPWGGQSVDDESDAEHQLARSDANFPWANYALQAVGNANLPVSWAAYDSAEIVVLPGDVGLNRGDPTVEALRSGAFDALLAWISAGGRAIVVLEPAGDAFRRFLESDAALAGISAAERAVVDAPTDLAVMTPTTAPRFPARELSLDAAAISAGWTVSWNSEVEPLGPPWSSEAGVWIPTPAATKGLVASGPIGFGQLTLLGFDPARTGRQESVPHTRAVWQRILRPVLEDGSIRHGRAESPWESYAVGSGANPSAAREIARSLDQLARVPPLDDSAAYFIGGAIVIFGLLVGPVDRLVSRRWRFGHLAWLSALGWITVAGSAAFFMPTMIRSSSTIVTRLVVADILAPHGVMRPSSASAAPAPTRAPSQVWRSGLTAVWGGEPIDLPLRSVDAAARVAPWWRGVSPVHRAQSRRTIAAPVTTRQSAPTLEALRVNDCQSLSLRQWTFRAVYDTVLPGLRGPGNESADWLSGVAISNATGALSDGIDIEVSGLPPGATFSAGRFRDLTGEVGLVASGPQVVGANGLLALRTAAVGATAQEGTGGDSGIWPFELPGSEERSGSIRRRIACGRWSAVTLRLRDVPSDLEHGDVANIVETEAVIRMLIPRSETMGGSDAPDARPQR